MISPTERPSLADRRAAASRDVVLEAAWELSRLNGLMGWSLRELATAVGLAAPSLYAYFESKNAIYDAMFRSSYVELEQLYAGWEPQLRDLAPRVAFARAVRAFFEFCTSDPTRYQLMFQRVIPDFVPSAEAYAASLASYERFRDQLAALGVTNDADLDLWTAIATGLTDQQISNDPGGARWLRLVDTAVELFCDPAGIPRDRESA